MILARVLSDVIGGVCPVDTVWAAPLGAVAAGATLLESALSGQTGLIRAIARLTHGEPSR
jgi:hypothetical protein